MKFKSTGAWVAILDPREKKPESKIELLAEAAAELKNNTDGLNTNQFTIHSAGDEVKNQRLKRSGVIVIIDPRMPLQAVIMDEGGDEVSVFLVQESQVMMVQE
tara:strand:- start:2409 stop:2717 length:309 start_codon:yes stop_codon:yes gene_type:complete